MLVGGLPFIFRIYPQLTALLDVCGRNYFVYYYYSFLFFRLVEIFKCMGSFSAHVFCNMSYATRQFVWQVKPYLPCYLKLYPLVFIFLYHVLQ
jgi:hypothetical protein